MTEKMPVFSAVDGSYSKFTEKLTFTPKFCIILNMVLSFISAAFHLKLEHSEAVSSSHSPPPTCCSYTESQPGVSWCSVKRNGRLTTTVPNQPLHARQTQRKNLFRI